MLKVEVRSRIVGQSQTDLMPSKVVLDLLNETITVAELIQQTVEEQIRDLLLNRKLDVAQMQRILDRQYLTDADVRRQAAEGAVRSPSAKSVRVPQIDPAAEAQKALRSFDQKTYMIVVDGHQAESLDELLTLRATSKVTFLRLTPLVGG
jgi:hypothetical protein